MFAFVGHLGHLVGHLVGHLGHFIGHLGHFVGHLGHFVGHLVGHLVLFRAFSTQSTLELHLMRILFSVKLLRVYSVIYGLTHSHTMTSFDAPRKQAS